MRKKLKRFVPLKEDAVIERIAFDISEQRHLLQRSNFFIIGYTKLMNASSGLCYDGADRHFTIQTDRCMKCGLCEKICPAENIRIDSSPVFEHKCEGCYACIHACPQMVISPGRFSVETQYRHPKIALHELLLEH